MGRILISKTVRQPRRRRRRFWAALLWLPLVGCAADRPLLVHLDAEVVRPRRAAVVFFIDGFGQAQFDEALADGRIPNIKRHILDRGLRVKAAVACVPSITYANSVTFLTGRFPGHHGVISNKWYDPDSARFRNYCFIKTYQQVDGDYRASPTLYEILHDRTTVSIQAAMRRGCTHTIDNWATSGVNWFFGNFMGVDCLVAQRLELIADHATRWGRWPDLIWVYFPGTDTIAHRLGPRSNAYRRAVANVDRQIGRVCAALQDIGMYERTTLCLVSDHGVVAVEKDNVFDVAAHLRDRAGARVWHNRPTTARDEQTLSTQFDCVVATSGSRWAAVYPLHERPGSAGADLAAFAESLRHADALIGRPGLPTDANPPRMPPWMSEALGHPAIELIACSFQPGCVHLFSRRGHAVITRECADPPAAVSGIPPDTAVPTTRHRVHQWPGSTIFTPEELLAETHEVDTSDSRAWLRATADARYPDLVPQIVAMFDSPHAGRLVFFAAEGWDFSTDDPGGGHGSILPGDMRVPMLFAGPGLQPGSTIPSARNCDLMPTLLGLLGAEPRLQDGTRVDIDGINLLPSLGAHRGPSDVHRRGIPPTDATADR